ATHGTGAKFGTLSTQLVGIRLITADGSALDLARESDPEGFRAAQVGLGALGVLSRLTIQCEPAFNLHAVEQPEKLDAVLESFEDRTKTNEHFEFYWFPHTDVCMTKENNRTDRPLKPKSRGKTWLDDVLVA